MVTALKEESTGCGRPAHHTGFTLLPGETEFPGTSPWSYTIQAKGRNGVGLRELFLF